MSVLPFEPATNVGLRLRDRISWWDAETECTVVISQPAVDPELWDEYLAGAHRSYRRFGVESALEIDELRAGGDTALFFAAVDSRKRMVGGLRAKGPLRSADDAHAVVEWAGQAGEQAVRKMIDDRVPFGVLEMKAAWVSSDLERSPHVTTALARTASHTMTILGNQFCMATSAAHVLERWRSSGGVVAANIPATPYPSERYQTRIMWWDRRTYARFAEPGQLARIVLENRHIERVLESQEDALATHDMVL
ncbi:hypothetical protein LV457_18825 [Mycobacterium sp. MYCO198283]|uniref:hypothetical protein n=1 Tax=Mycobacterium sp. MYCO198283 TaxID=2883505 RepID=UPI001E3C0CEA|nr:hypothetical protein [Mycobacterium sp. MYCO198283]MCG5434329.1 hypothetical protein [Mycobacterium sp. MYCO198283]